MKTVTIQIGNSDDKLTQVQWSWFVAAVADTFHGHQIHFSGGSDVKAEWQNYCWVVAVEEQYVDATVKALNKIRARYKQDSIAVTVGDTQFI